MKFDTTSLRRASSSNDVLPWRANDVALILVSIAGKVTQAQTIEEKRAMLDGASADDLLLAAWPGRWRQDIFVIDDRKAALLGLEPPGKRRSP